MSFVSSLSTPIWDQLLAAHGDDPLERMLVVSPFWGLEDPDGDEPERLLTKASEPKLWAGERRITLCVGELSSAAHRLPVKTVGDFSDFLELRVQSLQAEETRRLHAKLVVLAGKARTTLLWGSANFTPSAMLRAWSQGGNAECGLLVSRPRSELSIEQVEHAFGLHDVFRSHRGPLPEAAPVTLPPAAVFDVGEVLYEPSTGELSVWGERFDARARTLVLTVAGVPDFELRGTLEGDEIRVAWPARLLEETDPETGKKRLRATEVQIRVLDAEGVLLDHITLRINVAFESALELRDNLLLGAGALSADALLLPTTAPPEQRVAQVDRMLRGLRDARREGRGVAVRYQASLDVFYRNVRRGLDARFAMLEAHRGARFALQRWSSDLRRALDKATPDALDAPRRAFLLLRVAEHVARVLGQIPTWTQEQDAALEVIDRPALARALRALVLERVGLEGIVDEIDATRGRVLTQLEALP